LAGFTSQEVGVPIVRLPSVVWPVVVSLEMVSSIVVTPVVDLPTASRVALSSLISAFVLNFP
jgi:hypothetical protein